jgi:hypothetical protein
MRRKRKKKYPIGASMMIYKVMVIHKLPLRILKMDIN